MEREFSQNKHTRRPEKTPAKVPCETPRINGSKPSEIQRTSEESKKHVRHDERK